MTKTTMSASRNLSNFRQLSLSCETPSPRQKRQPFKKQFSEDIPDLKNSWLEQRPEIHISLNVKNKKLERNATDRPSPIKIAWGDRNESKNENIALNEEVIIKKCKEIKRVSSGKLTRHPSLEKDSILNSKQDLAERLRPKNQNVDKENDINDVKPNLKIFLTHNSQDYNDSSQSNITNSIDSQSSDNLESSIHQLEKSQPKYLQPLVTNTGQNNAFQIKKSVNKKSLDSPKAVEINHKRPNFCRSNTIVVVPLVEKEKEPTLTPTENAAAKQVEDAKVGKCSEPNGINVIIRPMTAQSRREKFQKRTNSAFHGTSKDQTSINFRPPLVRSSSAPSSRPEKSKFLASKRKLKGAKKFSNSPKGEDGSNKNVEAKEWKNAAQSASEVVTMVSLISPSGSENEDASEDESKESPKSVLKRESSVAEKSSSQSKDESTNKDVTKNVTLRKTVKSVSFQQSSIHAVRSFSASFPARRGSMASALSLGNNRGCNQKANIAKMQEKRGTNPDSPDADESVPKRRLVRSNTGESKASSSWQKAASQIGRITKTEKDGDINSTITIDIQAKADNTETETKILERTMKLDLQENVILIPTEEKETENKEDHQKEEPVYNTPKEEQCWSMYCKMTEKGINVSYDTILRGMLTPTEYRIRRKASVAEEMNMLMNPSLETTKSVPSECLIRPHTTTE